jgi:exodeoxyribonuclease VII large subunit
LELQRQEVLNTLVEQFPHWVWEREGVYHSKNQGLVLPLAVQRIALVTAPASDGQRDFLHELKVNPYGYAFEVDEYLTQIQGNGAEKLILNQFRNIVDSKKKYDAVVLVRGGGSQTDFGPFDTLELGKAIAAFPFPIITGIGHERNVSIADLLAHTSVKTPTKAAAFLVDINVGFESQLIGKAQQILQEGQYLVEQSSSLLNRKLLSITRLAELQLEKRNNKITQVEQAIHHLNPLKVLERGFAIITKDGQRISAENPIQKGDNLILFTHDSKIQSQVEEVEKLN